MLNTKPPGAPTEYSNPSCDARVLENCHEEVTGEHYISKKLLKRLGEFEADGFGWLAGKKTLTATALQSKVLCKRHNNALWPLDDNITQLYDLMRRWQDRKAVGVLKLDGEDLERWAVKVMFGMFSSGSARIPSANGEVLPRATPIPRKPLRFLFGEIELPRRAGFCYAHSFFGDLRPTSVRCRVDRGIDSKSPDSTSTRRCS